MSNVDSNLGELIFTRIWDAPRELVFDCMSKPEHLTHFWGPAGSSTPLSGITVDLRPGGKFVTVMVNDETGEEYTMNGVFVEVAPPERMVWTEADVEGGVVTSVTFNDIGDGKTETIVLQTNAPEWMQSPESRAGMLSSFDKMAAYLTTL